MGSRLSTEMCQSGCVGKLLVLIMVCRLNTDLNDIIKIFPIYVIRDITELVSSINGKVKISYEIDDTWVEFLSALPHVDIGVPTDTIIDRFKVTFEIATNACIYLEQKDSTKVVSIGEIRRYDLAVVPRDQILAVMGLILDNMKVIDTYSDLMFHLAFGSSNVRNKQIHKACLNNLPYIRHSRYDVLGNGSYNTDLLLASDGKSKLEQRILLKGALPTHPCNFKFVTANVNGKLVKLVAYA